MIFFQIFDFYAINSSVIFIICIFGLFGFLFNLVILSLFKVTRVLLEYYSSNGYSSNDYSSNTFFVTLLGYSSNTFSVTLLEVSSNAFCYSSTTLPILITISWDWCRKFKSRVPYFRRNSNYEIFIKKQHTYIIQYFCSTSKPELCSSNEKRYSKLRVK